MDMIPQNPFSMVTKSAIWRFLRKSALDENNIIDNGISKEGKTERLTG